MTNGSGTLDTAVSRSRLRVLDYLELTKPELTGLSVLTTLCGFFLAGNEFIVSLFLLTGLGTFFVGGGAGALNQYVERHFDAMMKRTERRPLPAGRIAPINALIFGVSLSMLGLVVLALSTNLLTVVLASATLLIYLCLYTPLKRSTPWATVIGAVPGALPPVMGWTAASNQIETGAWLLFGILFFWQMPHFLSLAWLYRKDYARAGYRMLAVLDSDGNLTSLYSLLSTIGLVAVSLMTSPAGITGTMYLGGALLLGFFFLLFCSLFRKSVGGGKSVSLAMTNHHSRQLFFASLVYLPALMFLMTADKL